MNETIELEKYFSRPIIKVVALNNINGKSITFPALIDTGSSKTLIDKDAIGILELNSISEEKSKMYVGDNCSGEYIIDIIFFEKYAINNYKVGCFEKKTDSIGLIIGTDILRNFEFIYNGIANEFTLRKK